MPSSREPSTPAQPMLYLVRHGESTYNAESRIQGQSDPPLSELGIRQAEALADAFASIPIEAVYSSPLQRASETAQRIANRLGLELHTDRRLMELHAGVFEGRLRAELEKECPAELTQWLGGDADFKIPGGESRRQLAERGSEAIRDIAAKQHRAAVVVAHGGLFSVALQTLLNLSQAIPPFSLKNGSITRLTVDGQGRFTLLALAEVEHLRGVGISLGGDL